jgi:hypothetical protein
MAAFTGRKKYQICLRQWSPRKLEIQRIVMTMGVLTVFQLAPPSLLVYNTVSSLCSSDSRKSVRITLVPYSPDFRRSC